MNKTLYMETTEINVDRTIAEIQSWLVDIGCTGIMTIYENKEVTALCFEILYLDRKIPFRLPARWEAIYRHLKSKKSKRWPWEADKIRALEEILTRQAKRVAWRQILRWVQAQTALIETDMVKVYEVFLPYMQTNINGETLFERVEKEKFIGVGYDGRE